MAAAGNCGGFRSRTPSPLRKPADRAYNPGMSSIDTNQIVGLVLAGGQSRRMGGGDKGLLQIGGRSMLERVVARLAPQAGRIVLNANGDPVRFARLGLPVAADTIEGFPGGVPEVFRQQFGSFDGAAAGGPTFSAPFAPELISYAHHQPARPSWA